MELAWSLHQAERGKGKGGTPHEVFTADMRVCAQDLSVCCGSSEITPSLLRPR